MRGITQGQYWRLTLHALLEPLGSCRPYQDARHGEAESADPTCRWTRWTKCALSQACKGVLMKPYRVTWVIDVEAENEQEAARQALAIQRDPHSSATVFEVR